MNANKIDGIVPFNKFLFRSCYYHQLISALSCFGIDEDNVLCNMFLFLSENFGVEERNIIPEKELLKRLGCKMTRCGLTKSAFCRNLDKGSPLIVGADCYYLESRRDTYLTRHAPHYLLMYGYDVAKDEAYVIDHKYFNSVRFEQTTISFGNMLTAAKNFRRWKKKMKYACRAVKNKVPQLNCEYLNLWKELPAGQFEKNRNISEKNLRELKELFAGDENNLKQKLQLINKYVNSVRQFFKILASVKILQVDGENIDLNRLVAGYGIIQSMIWKMNEKQKFTVTKEQQDKLISKIDEIIELEDRVYDELARVLK